MAKRRFPARIRIGVPSGGFGQRYAEMTSWLDGNRGADGWAMTPSGIRAAQLGLAVFETDDQPPDE